ncbi:H-type lectin domain-containing protein [Pseudooceanicola sp. 502str34]|uniref:H-type lectin domain-containing protein n=1 Tax=Maritimibacter alkaliphilus TaxID=404236 RepID=UPI001C976672|nr:H-type lectin domain-containing protein [Maritimibacter alkaliphilus]MBY6090820.1 H-type lectin domain-containing protein [Maritimibacter alkaliphilus]
MKRLRKSMIGVDQGEDLIFSDFEEGGDMWTGDGPRERRLAITFSENFRTPPVVHCALSLWDVGQGANLRADVTAEEITPTGFDLVFRTWGDTKIARARARWMAIGELSDEDEWDV